MAPSPQREKLGRRLRVGMVGGGSGAQIAPVHRMAMRLDDHYDLVAGVLSSSPARSLLEGERLRLPRVYRTIEDMLRLERERPDPIDIVVVVTPNDTHYSSCMAALGAGYHVICDKPLANTLAEAKTIERKVASSGLKFCVTYNYSGYAMVRQARALVAAGTIGELHFAEIRYAQGNLAIRVENAAELSSQLRWRLDPQRGGASGLMLDVGTHSYHLISYLTGGRALRRAWADVGPSFDGREFDDTALVAARLEPDLRVGLTVTKAATGSPQAFGFGLFGSEGGLVWDQQQANSLLLLRQGRPAEQFWPGVALEPLARRALREPGPHPAGFVEAFANIYSDFAEIVAAQLTGEAPDPLALTCPTATDGVAGLDFVESCERSRRSGTWEKSLINNSVRAS